MQQENSLDVVIGLGSSGLSAVVFLCAQGRRVAVTDEQPAPSLAPKLPENVQAVFGVIDEDLLLTASRIVISPGVNPSHPAIKSAKLANIPILSDIQLFCDELRARDERMNQHTPIVAITGSNAKSTVTTLVGEMAKQAGKVVGVGGNIGTPALDLLSIDGMELAVLELSSFQLEHISHLGASVATILNISPDHLDRHGDMAGYLGQKLKIFNDAKAAVICFDDEQLQESCRQALNDNGAPNVTVITTSGIIDCDCHADFCLVKPQDDIYLCHDNKHLLSADELFIKGKHNLLNALSALALGRAIGLELSAMIEALKTFKGLPHRCEYVDEVAGRAYFNDSKGTNIGSTLAAINGLGAVYGERSLAIILGGLGKGQDFSELGEDIERYAHSIYLIGADAGIIKKQLEATAKLSKRIHQVDTLQVAVDLASQSLVRAVLLSPACASFDQFKSYADRGDKFVSMVNALA